MVKKNEKLRKIGILLPVIVLAIAIVFLVGKSFSFFSYRKDGKTVNVITFKGLDVEILNSANDALNLANSYPVYDSEGLDGTPFEFTVENKTSSSVNYTMTIENDTDKQQACTVNNEICPVLSTNYIRYAYSINDGAYSTPANLGTNNGVVLTDQLAINQKNKISILLWIDQDAPNSIQGQYFFGKVVLSAVKSS